MSKKEYLVELDNFTGPLELLLNMIKDKNLNIFEIDLDKLTQQYLVFIDSTEKLNIEIASEYLVMAAYLLEIKSKSLLPKEEIKIDNEYETDTREQLIARILEYKKIKEVTKHFQDLKEQAQQLISKPKSKIKIEKRKISETNSTNNISIDNLANVFMKMIEQINANQPIESNIVKSRIQPEEMANKIISILSEVPDKDWLLEDLISKFDADLTTIVASFIALLDLARHQKIYLIQNNNWGPIFVKYLIN